MDYTGKIISKNPPQPTQASASGVWTLDEAAAAVKNNSWPIPGVPNPISKSLRFNQADDTYLNRTFATAGNRTIWTWSGWIKRTNLSDFQYSFFAAGSGANYDEFRFNTADKFRFFIVSSSSVVLDLITTQVFRDVSAWYHVVVAYDSTQATSSNRAKLYINGAQVTAFDTATYPAQNTSTSINNNVEHRIGLSPSGFELNGYMTEVYFIDGQALTPSSFGQTNANTGVWEPKPYTGTYGGNGFYLNFKDSATTTALGYDYSGNGNNWTPNNFSVTAGAGNDSLVDVPTQWIGYNTSGDTGGIWRGNYCTLNPLNKSSVFTFANGNLDVTSTTGYGAGTGTIGMSSGKWYWEVTITTVGSEAIGIAKDPINLGQYGGQSANSWIYTNNGQKANNDSFTSYGNTYTTGDVIGVGFNADNGELKFYKNGTVQNSGTAAFTGLTSGPYYPTINNNSAGGGTTSVTFNFGQRPFAYTPPAGFVSLCTTNLPTPTIGATSTTQAGKYFNPVLYTGTGSSLGVTGVGFQPDWTWIKSRSAATDHGLYDAVRGVQKQLESNNTDAETTETTGLTAFNSDGFTVGALAQLNTNTATYVAWNWNGGGSNATNTSGSITSTVRANTTAGFSIVTYTGTGANATVGHGLGVAPQMIIIKNRTGSGVSSGWGVYHVGIGATKYLALEQTAAAGTSSALWNNTAPTSTVFSLGNEQWVNTNGGSQVAYCFAPVAGYSAFGSYVGVGGTDGAFVFTGFRPAYVLIKSTAANDGWVIQDATRFPNNVITDILAANSSSAESTFGSSFNVDFLSNGFKIRNATTTMNNSGTTYVYAAFATVPFKYSLAR